MARGIGRDPKDFACKALVKHFWNFPKPSICAVNGLAVGGGANLALVCHDMVYAGASARFMFPFSKLGVTPEFGSSILLPVMVGMARAKQLLMCSEWFTATQAEQMGLVNAVLPDERLMAEVTAMATKLAKFEPMPLARSKALMNGHFQEQVLAALDIENVAFNDMINSEQFQKKVQAMAKAKQSKPKAKL